MGEGDHAAETPGPAAEPQGDVAEDHEQGEEDGDDGGTLDVVRDRGAHLVGTDDTVRVVEGRGEAFEGDVLPEEALEGAVEHLLDLVVHGRGFVVVLVGGRDLHLALTTELLDLDGTVEDVERGLADGLGRHRLVKADDIGTAAGEVDTVGEALGEDRHEAD